MFQGGRRASFPSVFRLLREKSEYRPSRVKPRWVDVGAKKKRPGTRDTPTADGRRLVPDCETLLCACFNVNYNCSLDVIALKDVELVYCPCGGSNEGNTVTGDVDRVRPGRRLGRAEVEAAGTGVCEAGVSDQGGWES